MTKAKVLSGEQAKGVKINEAGDVSSIPTSNRNEQPVEEVPTLAVPNSTSTDPVSTVPNISPANAAHACDIAAHTLELQDYDALSYELRDAAVLLRQMSWQPFHTAPKDGDILVGGPGWMAVSSCRVKRFVFTHHPPLIGERPQSKKNIPDWPTHWMPLPATPVDPEAVNRG